MASERFYDAPSKLAQLKLTKAIRLFANGCSSRSIELKIRMDRQSVKRWLDHGIRFSDEYAKKIRCAVIQHNYTYQELLDRYGKKGLTAVFKWYKDKTYKDNGDLAKKVVELRKKGVTYQELSNLTGRSISSLQRSVNFRYGADAWVGNVAFNKVKTRDAQILANYRDGMTIHELSAKYGKSPITIRGILHDKFGVSIQHASVASKHFDTIKLLRSKGMNWKEIAYVVRDGASPQSIRKSFEEENFRRTMDEEPNRTGSKGGNTLVESGKRR